jgi:hypothetical protein
MRYPAPAFVRLIDNQGTIALDILDYSGTSPSLTYRTAQPVLSTKAGCVVMDVCWDMMGADSQIRPSPGTAHHTRTHPPSPSALGANLG